MKKIVLLALNAALLSACSTLPYGGGPYGPAPYPGSGGFPAGGPMPGPVAAPYRAVGTEPGWTLDIDPVSMRFSGPYGQGPVEEPTPRVIVGFAGEIYQGRRINVNIVHGQCTDGMSDRTYPDKVQLAVDGRSYSGCGGSSDRPGQPGTTTGALADSHWRIVTVNGRPVPVQGDYHMDFAIDRVSARFGCNRFNGPYTLDRDMLSTGPLMATRMACAGEAGSLESQGSAVLNLPARVRWSPGRATLINNAGVIELERR